MKGKVYIDTSVLAAYYCNEMLSEKAEKSLLSIQEPAISLLTEIEFYSVLLKKYRKKEVAKQAATKIISLFSTHVKEGYYKKILIESEHYLLAKDFLKSLAYSLHSLDSMHLALAAKEKIPFITFDVNLQKVAKKLTIDLIKI